MTDISLSDAQQQAAIDRSIVDAVLAGRLKSGARLVEQQIADLFGVSRTLVREALLKLEAMGIVEASARRGWFVVEPSVAEAREAFEARRAVEVGLLGCAGKVGPVALAQLREHLRAERAAIAADDVGERSFLLGDFHVCLAQALGNRVLADILRGLTARTVLIAALYQSDHDATASCDDHEAIVGALQAGDHELAARLMRAHIGDVEAALKPVAPAGPLAELRAALAPVGRPAPAAAAPRPVDAAAGAAPSAAARPGPAPRSPAPRPRATSSHPRTAPAPTAPARPRRKSQEP